MHSDIYEPICFRLGMMIDTNEPYILMLVYVTLTLTLTLIQDNRNARNKKILCDLSPKVTNGFRWNLACC